MIKIIYANDYIGKYPNLSLLEICNRLKDEGFSYKEIKIKVSCSVCGKEIIVIPSVYRKQKGFKCQEHIRPKPKGKDSPFYNRIKTSCSYCGKDIYVVPYDYNKKNQHGKANLFCSRDCYAKYRSQHYCAENSPMYKHKYTEQQLLNIKAGVIHGSLHRPQVNSKIQQIVDGWLNDMNIKYQREYILDYYACDNYFTDYNLILEVMGDYWHGNPLIYNENNRLLNKIQARTILKDKQKKGYIAKHYGYNILYLWESDIIKYPHKCIELIKAYVFNKGLMDDYHSFNYLFNTGELHLNENIIIPYQDIPSNNYKHLIKEK